MTDRAISNRLYTVGHSNITFDQFLALLNQHNIDVIVDVRSHPFSKYATHFNYDSIQVSLKNSSIKYLYLGKELGGMPKNPEFYDRDGYLVYSRVAGTDAFKGGIARLVKGSRDYTIALMCGEENPAGCHRRHLIGPALRAQNLELVHIRAGGQVQTEADLANLESGQNPNQQLSLFD